MMWQICIACFTVLLVTVSFPSHAVIQRWVDEHGVVHYGDRIPSEYLGKGSIQLNNQGVRVKAKNRSLTDSEKQQELKAQEQQLQVNREQEEQNRRDRSLLDTYANVEEITRARTRALESVDNAMNVTTVRLSELTKQKIILDAKLQNSLPHAAFAKVSAERAANLNEIQHLNDILTKRKQERLQTEQRYSGDLRRYNEITAAIAAKKKSTSTGKDSLTQPVNPTHLSAGNGGSGLIRSTNMTPLTVPPLQSTGAD